MAQPIVKVSRKVVQRIALAFLALLVVAIPGDTVEQAHKHTKNDSAKAAERDSDSR